MFTWFRDHLFCTVELQIVVRSLWRKQNNFADRPVVENSGAAAGFLMKN